MELKIGIVPFNDPRNPLNTTAQEETSLRTYLKEVARLHGADPDDPVDLDIRLVKGSYYQILQWMREGQLDGAVVSSFTAYLLMRDPHLALLPVIEFARTTSRPMFSVRGKGAESPEAALWDCLEAVQKSLKDPPATPPCELRFVSHLSTTGFVVPLIYIEEKFVRERGMTLPEQQAFWTRLLQWSRLDLLHGVENLEQKAETSIAFTYIKDTKSVSLPVKDVTNLADVLLLGCRRNQPDPLPGTEDKRRALLRECQSDNSFLGALADPEAASPWERAGAVIQAGRGYVRTTAWSREARDEFAQRIESVFLPAGEETALSALFARWYDEGRYAFSIDEVIDVLKVDQVIRKAPRAALVLPGGGVRATYQSVILDHLYAHRIVNAGIAKHPATGNQCPATQIVPVVDPRLLVINGIAGTSGGALLGYFASRRDTRASKALTELWIDDQTVKTTALDIFPAMGALRVLSLLLLVAVFAATSAVHVRRERGALKGEVPFWYTTFLSIFIIAAPFFIWRNARSDPKYTPTFEAVALLIIIILVHFIHSVSMDGASPRNPMRWLRRGIAFMAGGVILALTLFETYELVVPDAIWKRTLSALWTLGVTAALILIIFGLSFLAAARGLRLSSHRLHEYREALFLLLVMIGLSFAVFAAGWWMRRVTPLEMTLDYWVWVFIAAIFSTTLILTAERVYGNVPLLHGIRFLSSPSGTAPFPYTPAVTLVIWGSLGIVVWLTFVAPALYSSERGREEFDTAVEQWRGVERVPLIVSMTGLGEDVEGFRSPPYRGDYYAVDQRWCFVDELQGRLFRSHEKDFRNAVFASGSPFPIYPATQVQAEPGELPGLFVDGGFAHRVPIEAAGLVGAEQILIVENVARVDVPVPQEGFRAGALPTNAAKALDFLFERSQMIDGQRARSAVVATIYPDWSPPNPFLMDFRESVVKRLRAEAEKDLEGHRVARVESWGAPTEEALDDGT